MLRLLDPHVEASSFARSMSQFILVCLFLGENCFVQLLYTQHWSFLSSVVKSEKQGAVWFAPIAGLGSVASTMAGLVIGPLVQRFGLTGLILVGSIIIGSGAFHADMAYAIAKKVGSPMYKGSLLKSVFSTFDMQILMAPTGGLYSYSFVELL